MESYLTVLVDITAGMAALWLVALMLVIAHRFICGRIPLRNLLSCSLTGAPSQGRMQALLISLSAASAYTALALGHMTHGNTVALPHVPNWMLALVGASHLGYLGGKAGTARKLMQSQLTNK